MTSEYSRTQVLRHRPSYLADLQMLMGWPVAADDLLSTDESLFIREGKFKKCPKMERHFRAGFVGSNDFFELLGILQKLNPSPISVWITHTRGIGALVVPTLRDISYTYAFQIVGELAAFVTTDGNDRLLVVNDLDDRSEILIAALASHISWIDSVLGQDARGVRIAGEKLMPVIVKVPDNGDRNTHIGEPAGNFRHCTCCFVVVDRYPDELASGA